VLRKKLRELADLPNSGLPQEADPFQENKWTLVNKHLRWLTHWKRPSGLTDLEMTGTNKRSSMYFQN
jgi:hypothetical protein